MQSVTKIHQMYISHIYQICSIDFKSLSSLKSYTCSKHNCSYSTTANKWYTRRMLENTLINVMIKRMRTLVQITHWIITMPHLTDIDFNINSFKSRISKWTYFMWNVHLRADMLRIWDTGILEQRSKIYGCSLQAKLKIHIFIFFTRRNQESLNDTKKDHL